MMNIDEMTYDQLADLNKRVVARMRRLGTQRQVAAMDSFNVGDQVHFVGKDGRTEYGTVVKHNHRTVSVRSDRGVQWRVSPTLLSRIVPGSEAADQRRQDLIAKRLRSV